MPSATTGAVSAVRDFGSFLSCVFHKSCNPETFLTLRVSSPNAQPERCGSCPTVGQSAPQSAPQLRNKKLSRPIKLSVFKRRAERLNCGALCGADWPTFGHDPQRSG